MRQGRKVAGALTPPPGCYSRHEAELGVCGEGLPLTQGSGRQQPFLPTAVVLGSVPALVLHRSRWREGAGWGDVYPATSKAHHLPPSSPLTSQASKMVTMSPFRKASSPGLGREFSHLVIH